MKNKVYKQGDIVVINFPFTDGSEFKKRPGLIISNQKVNDTNDFLIVQITSKIRLDSFSIPVEDDFLEEPLSLKSFIRTHKLFTVHKSLIISKKTTARPALVAEVIEKIYDNLVQ